MSEVTIGTFLKKMREKNNLSQKEVAGSLNYKNINFISMVENDVSKIPVNRIMDFVKAYRLKPFLGLVIVREVYGEIWKAMIETEKVASKFIDFPFAKLDKRIQSLYEKELKKCGIKSAV
jgi:transcriptional regulator with XRE-family HTH domain